jgi:hypothetical protein
VSPVLPLSVFWMTLALLGPRPMRPSYPCAWMSDENVLVSVTRTYTGRQTGMTPKKNTYEMAGLVSETLQILPTLNGYCLRRAASLHFTPQAHQKMHPPEAFPTAYESVTDFPVSLDEGWLPGNETHKSELICPLDA